MSPTIAFPSPLVFLMQNQLDCCNLAQKNLLMKATIEGLNHVEPSKT
jgi:hypothetical protein